MSTSLTKKVAKIIYFKIYPRDYFACVQAGGTDLIHGNTSYTHFFVFLIMYSDVYKISHIQSTVDHVHTFTKGRGSNIKAQISVFKIERER